MPYPKGVKNPKLSKSIRLSYLKNPKLREMRRENLKNNNPAKRQDVKDKIRIANYKENLSSETLKKRSMALKGRIIKDEWKVKMSLSAKKRLSKKENHPNWQGGKSFEPYGVEFSEELKNEIRKRDGYKCQECGCSQVKLGQRLDVHHIDYNKKNNVPENLISLCRSCHLQTNFERSDWENYFKNKINGLEKTFLQLR
jgi:5-methylcytosine-specific restriction endonuclease McrA